ncbi:type II secretion system F family protein [Demequina aurantiaca]|uniref:type II secretion system F family protein n=1 Tax=Demequina aurantiaca TaxID=676200 RepID=UPI000ADC7509|nr:type II secretion system F family protein [Demequina aurantiaca]
MTTVWGLCLGAGLFLVWRSMWAGEPAAHPRYSRWRANVADSLVQAGMPNLTPGALVAASVIAGGLVALTVGGLAASLPIGLCFGILAGRAPSALVAMRARGRRESMRTVWPDVVDNLASGIRAGLPLAEALSQVAETGPEQVRPAFDAFAQDYRATGRFADSLDALKARVADPVADRIVEAIRITRDVGGSDVGHVLRTLAEFLRDDARARGEIEARQSWTVNAARLAVAAPWVVLALLSSQPSNTAAFNSPAGLMVLAVGGIVTVVAYRLMVRIGRLPVEVRVLR